MSPVSINSTPLNVRQRAVARKITWTLFAAQCLGSAGFIAAATINSIAGRQLTGSDALATVPEAIYQLGVSVAALGWGYGMDRFGRRGGLALGVGVGALGALIVSLAIIQNSLPLFLLGLVCMGIARSALQLARFVAAEVHPPAERARAISNVVIGGSVATLIWAGLSRLLGPLMTELHIDQLTWPYLASLALFILTGVIIIVFLRPDPREVGREISQLGHADQQVAATQRPARSLAEIFRQPAVLVAAGAMVFGQAVMVMIMIITPLHMSGHQHVVEDISLVISSHVFGMYAFSILSGRFADRFGRGAAIAVGSITLVLASLLAPLSPDVLPLGVALFLLGVGWNFCYVGGSSLLADQLSPDERARTQGFNDLLIGLVSALGSLGSGFVFSSVGYRAMGFVGAVVALIPLALTLWRHATRDAAIQTSTATSAGND